eukprot:TRINITY_DN34747_c0_g1_i1.p1 TRINITY_DN34747_c0_g1~~TRINITY_DN34747_c0_g1_i1.p1  ORF type:complete len:305 (+),score=56.10 TRINITY_DN34747_c0_g1_i1:82-996(+)
MVGMMQTFGSGDMITPHGGPPFQGWRKGFGFGHSAGAGSHVGHPSNVQKLRSTPAGDRCLASNPFWRRKWELGQASSFGVGDRPSSDNARDADIAPNTYGDVSRHYAKVRKNHVRDSIKLKERYPSAEERARDTSWPQGGPGPAKYDTTNTSGKSSWAYPALTPSWSFGPRISASTAELKESASKPAPNAYVCWSTPGRNAPDRKGGLYDIVMKGRYKHHQPGSVAPGPGHYPIPGELDKYGLAQKIAAVKVPKKSHDGYSDPGMPATPTFENLSGLPEETLEVEDCEDDESPKFLSRVESAPL